RALEAALDERAALRIADALHPRVRGAGGAHRLDRLHRQAHGAGRARHERRRSRADGVAHGRAGRVHRATAGLELVAHEPLVGADVAVLAALDAARGRAPGAADALAVAV